MEAKGVMEGMKGRKMVVLKKGRAYPVAVVDGKGRITIPKEIREQLGVKTFAVYVVDGKVLLDPVDEVTPVVSLDKRGRISLPKGVRDQASGNAYVVLMDGEKLLLDPIKI